jgi:hypothetical protein
MTHFTEVYSPLAAQCLEFLIDLIEIDFLFFMGTHHQINHSFLQSSPSIDKCEGNQIDFFYISSGKKAFQM